MIEKPAIVVTSLGRTGTLFFAHLFQEILPDVTSLHEPDYLNFGQYAGWQERGRQIWRQLKESGAANLLVRKPLGQWDLLKLSHDRVRQRLDLATAVVQTKRQRTHFVRSRPGSIYVESSTAAYGLIDVFPQIFSNHKLIYIVRDGRFWVQSKMNFGTMYSKSKLHQQISILWPTAKEIPHNPYGQHWDQLTRFEKICWAWQALNEYAINTLTQNPDAHLIKFEDIFIHENRAAHLETLIRWSTSHIKHPIKPFSAAQLLSQKVHGSHKKFPHWKDWSDMHRAQFNQICGPLMRRLGYFED